MPWWGWILVGTLLLGSEMLVDAGLYLLFLGVGALAVGLIDVSDPGWPLWGEWLAFAALAGAATVVFRRRLYGKMHPEAPEIGNSVVGERILLTEALAPGAEARAELRGSAWTIRNTGDQLLPAGTRARVEAIDGLILELRAD